MTLRKTTFGTLALAGVALAALAAAPAQASPIIFNFTGTVSGTDTVNGVITPFTDQNVSFFAFGDTSNVSNVGTGGSNVFVLNTNPVAFALTGVGSGVVTDAVHVFDNQGDAAAGLTDTAPGKFDILDESDPSFATYGLNSSLGPIPTQPTFTSGYTSFNTTLGAIQFTDLSNTTFTAIAVPAVPEASTTASFGLLLALGMGGLAVAKRRKASASA